MFTHSELGGIVLLADVAVKMERILSIFGIEQSVEERLQVLHLKAKATELLKVTPATTDEKVESILRS